MDFDKNAEQRKLFEQLKNMAKQFKTQQVQAKYAPKAEPMDSVDEAVDSVKLPSVDDVQEEMDGQKTLKTVEEQGPQNEAVADEALEEQRRVLSGLDEDRMKSLLSGLKSRQ